MSPIPALCTAASAAVPPSCPHSAPERLGRVVEAWTTLDALAGHPARITAYFSRNDAQLKLDPCRWLLSKTRPSLLRRMATALPPIQ